MLQNSSYSIQLNDGFSVEFLSGIYAAHSC